MGMRASRRLDQPPQARPRVAPSELLSQRVELPCLARVLTACGWVALACACAGRQKGLPAALGFLLSQRRLPRLGRRLATTRGQLSGVSGTLAAPSGPPRSAWSCAAARLTEDAWCAAPACACSCRHVGVAAAD